MRLELQISGNGLSERTQVLEGNPLEVGRDPDVAWPLPDNDATELVSAVHLRISEENGVCSVADADSTNGTFLNGERLTERTPLTIGDRLELGSGGPVITVLGVATATLEPAPVGTGTKAPELPVRPVGFVVVAVVLIGAIIGRETGFLGQQSSNGDAASQLPGSQSETAGADHVPPASDDAARLLTKNDSVTVEAGGRLVIDVLANDGSETERPRFVVNSVSESRMGAGIEVSADRKKVIYTAPASGNGVDRITYNVADGETDARGTALLQVEIRPAVVDLAEWERAVTWIGFRYIDEMHADECGWFVSPDKVVTSARAAAGLKLLKDSATAPAAIELVVAYEDEFLSVDRVTLHSGYDVSDPGARNSLVCDVGILHLASPASSVRPCVIETAKPDAAELDTELRVIGFANETDLTELHDITRVRRVQTSVPVTGSMTGTIHAAPILTSSEPYTRGMSGAPVFNAEGRVTGVLSHFNDRLVIVPARALLELTQ